jgi:hypothetical protein
MPVHPCRYRYVGPPELRAAVGEGVGPAELGAVVGGGVGPAELRAAVGEGVGPAELRAAIGGGQGSAAVTVSSAAVLDEWLSGRDRAELAEPFTFVVGLDGFLRLAPRRSEHVACAVGEDVLAAGEMSFARRGPGWAVQEVSNQSTGYCPDPDSWPAVTAALDRVGIKHPPDFTHKLLFRRCSACGQVNVVGDEDFVCAVCAADLPSEWNIGPAGPEPGCWDDA